MPNLTTPVANQATNPATPRLRGWTGLLAALLICLVTLGVTLWHPTDAYTQAVLGLSGDPAKGRAIFVMNCVDCHGQWADGKVGPSLRNVSERLSLERIVHQVVSGDTPPMPQFQPQPQEMADLLSYLRQL
ncbi:MAG: cytochrome c [Pseudanabaenaceae cyanobacterium bins.68]|nr:cytochrome c [Pseudanabaenaceae cyanobacterium bins.68]